ncbi:hypothetical protein [Novosphingobium beihaiensis]|uniref:Uncharacterized protein n=1 Tax=Novosphingobium beihaiensis TaxID=2930389 RepID=A0ABT0BNV6_9SPHN|nr:hypothetical protein [Novosphingobium beihaiensis]MCJ2186731.1 hypothetical protein [Novosphingobium beihaiensis]
MQEIYMHQDPLTLSLSKGAGPALRQRPSTGSGRAEAVQIADMMLLGKFQVLPFLQRSVPIIAFDRAG